MKVAGNHPKIDVPRLPSSFYAEYVRKRASIAQDIQMFLNDRREIHFYGAGLTLSWILYELRYGRGPRCETVIDDNPLVHGRFMPQTSCRVSALDVDVLAADSTVLCTLNPTYHSMVMRRLATAGYRGKVLGVGSQGLYEVMMQQ